MFEGTLSEQVGLAMFGSLCAQLMQMLVLMLHAFTPFCRQLEDASQAQGFPKPALLPVVTLVGDCHTCMSMAENSHWNMLSACSCGGWLLAQSGAPAM